MKMGLRWILALISREFNSGEGSCSMRVRWGEGKRGEGWGGDLCACVCACEREYLVL
jgi:hypothetical protein